MRKWKALRIPIFLLLLSCSEENPDSSFVGPLSISDLSYNPTEIYIDPDQSTFTVSGSIHFANAQGGAAQLKISSPEGGDITIDVAHSNGITEGIISGEFEFLMPDLPVTYSFDIWLIDASKRVSN